MSLLLAEIDWNALLQKPDILPMLLVFGTTTIVILGVTMAIQWRKAQQAKYEAQLKEQMIARGFTADEIKKVVSAGADHRSVTKAATRLECAEPFLGNRTP
jgi:Tfp pilus assembly protein PilN